MTTCPVCKNDQKKLYLCKVSLVLGAEYDLVKCTNCSVIYFNPLPTIDHLKRFYSASYYNFNRWHDEAKGIIYAKKLTKLKKSGRFLDVGCATGFFINAIKNNSSWNVHGVDFSRDAVEFAQKQLNLDVKRGNLQDVSFPDQYFDYIHINNVLEHVLDPLSLLKECKRIIKSGGYFFLSVPNGLNDSKVLIDFYKSEYIPARSVNGHIFFFPAKTLLNLFAETGFSVSSRKTGSIKRGLRNSGLLRKKKNWKQQYFPQEQKSPEKSSLTVSGERKYPRFYYKFRYIQNSLRNIPGLYDFGLDFTFLLRPKDNDE
ncbi:class I SAM-dependent methyltransferase [candidate division KSB1 bacterium]|nr:class I SAM-dependent methyltransferase [candidate division KSB1 bacterium]